MKFLRSKDETPEIIIKLIKQLQVRLNKTVKIIRTDNGTQFVYKQLTLFYESVGISHHKSVPRTPQQNAVVERRNRTLVEATRTMLIFSKTPMFLWAEAIATACYTQSRSLIHPLHNKPYELVHLRKPDRSFLCVFGALCYPTNDSEDLGKLRAKADIGVFLGYAPDRKGYRIYNKSTRQIMETIHVTFDELTEHMVSRYASFGPSPNPLSPGPISSGLVQNPTLAIPYVPPTSNELKNLFDPFDEYFELQQAHAPEPHVADPPVAVANTPQDTNGPSASISIGQDSSSTSNSQTTSNIESLSIHLGTTVDKYFEVNPFAPPVDVPFENIFAPESSNDATSSGDSNTATSVYYPQPHDHLRKWTNDHPIDNIIGNPSRPISTRKQLATDDLWCFFNFVLSKAEPKDFKDHLDL